MGRYLIVANQTLGGPELERIIRDRLQHGESHFYIVVPTVEPKLEARQRERGLSITESDWIDSGVRASPQAMEAARRREEMVGPAHSRAESRLTQMINKIESVGGQADGEVGGSDPLAAVESILARRSFAEVIISTLPPGMSRWLKMDLPSRASRLTDVPITTVEANN